MNTSSRFCSSPWATSSLSHISAAYHHFATPYSAPSPAWCQVDIDTFCLVHGLSNNILEKFRKHAYTGTQVFCYPTSRNEGTWVQAGGDRRPERSDLGVGGTNATTIVLLCTFLMPLDTVRFKLCCLSLHVISALCSVLYHCIALLPGVVVSKSSLHE